MRPVAKQGRPLIVNTCGIMRCPLMTVTGGLPFS
jgi:hypothetical protein